MVLPLQYPNYWRTIDDQTFELWAQGNSCRAIGLRLRRDPKTIKKSLLKMGVKVVRRSGPRPAWKKVDRTLISDLWFQGYSLWRISKMVGLDYLTIKSRLLSWGVQVKHRYPKSRKSRIKQVDKISSEGQYQKKETQ